MTIRIFNCAWHIPVLPPLPTFPTISLPALPAFSTIMNHQQVTHASQSLSEIIQLQNEQEAQLLILNNKSKIISLVCSKIYDVYRGKSTKCFIDIEGTLKEANFTTNEIDSIYHHAKLEILNLIENVLFEHKLKFHNNFNISGHNVERL